MLTFEQFKASREWCTDIGAAIGADMGRAEPVTGNLYLGVLYIEAVDEHWPEEAQIGKWHLLLNNQAWTQDDLEALEHRLYVYARTEGYSTPSLDEMVRQYADWNERQGLSLGSADEHLHDESLTDEQRKWLRSFSERWEEMERLACSHQSDGSARCRYCNAVL